MLREDLKQRSGGRNQPPEGLIGSCSVTLGVVSLPRLLESVPGARAKALSRHPPGRSQGLLAADAAPGTPSL